MLIKASEKMKESILEKLSNAMVGYDNIFLELGVTSARTSTVDQLINQRANTNAMLHAKKIKDSDYIMLKRLKAQVSFYKKKIRMKFKPLMMQKARVDTMRMLHLQRQNGGGTFRAGAY